MKTLYLSIVLCFSFIMLSAQDEGQNISILVNNATSNKGKVIFSLHTAESFMRTEGVQNSESLIENGEAKITFKNVKRGIYAVMVLHDENENNRMDFHDNGMPKENYGMSNNPMSYGPPQFTDAKFEVKEEDLELLIRF